MVRLLVRSRRWNLVLAVLGSIYAVSTVVLLFWFVLDVWSAEAITDRLLQLVLLVSALCSVWMVSNSLNNLGHSSSRSWHGERREPLTSTPSR
jgi:hypothetical protein